MPTKPKRKCSQWGCTSFAEPGSHLCAAHKKMGQVVYDRGRETATRRGYDTRWRKVRCMKLAANPLCEDCLKTDQITQATLVHHINGNPSDNLITNLKSLCVKCHSAYEGHGLSANGMGRGGQIARGERAETERAASRRISQLKNVAGGV